MFQCLLFVSDVTTLLHSTDHIKFLKRAKATDVIPINSSYWDTIFGLQGLKMEQPTKIEFLIESDQPCNGYCDSSLNHFALLPHIT